MSKEENTTSEEKVPEEAKAPEAEAQTAPETTPVEEKTEAPATEAVSSEPASNEDAPAVEESADTATEEATPVALPHRDLKAGMVVRVHEVIKDTNAKGEERQRVQVFEGTILGLNGSGITRTMTVRKTSGGVGVEKIYPLSSPHVEKVEILKQLRTRRSKLWFLRKGKTKRRMKEIKA